MDQRNVYINELHDFSKLEELLNINSSNEPHYNALNLDNDIGVGFVRRFEHSSGIISINYDLTLKETLDIPIHFIKSTTTQFIYVCKGECDYLYENGDTINLKQFQTAISISKEGSISKLRFKKNTRIVLNIIDLRKSVYTKILDTKNCSFSKKVFNFINKLNNSYKTVFIGQYNLKMAEHFKNYSNQVQFKEHNGLLAAEGTIYLILSHHFQLALNHNNINTISNLLNHTELKKVNDLSDEIKANPEVEYSLNFLSSKSGLSPAKLQEGFKSLFNRTVSDYIRYIRLLKAEQLMSTTDLNISEIVYTIGFTSRSYFCKIFKREFNCSPKQYKGRIKNIALL